MERDLVFHVPPTKDQTLLPHKIRFMEGDNSIVALEPYGASISAAATDFAPSRLEQTLPPQKGTTLKTEEGSP